MNELNPYRSLTLIEPASDSNSAPSTISGRFDAKQRLVLYKAMELVNGGHLVATAFAIWFGLRIAFQISTPLEADYVNGRLLLFGVGGGLLVKIFGVLIWCSLPGQEKAFSMLAMALQVLGMVATGAFIVVVLKGRFVGGLFTLFGASAFAMLLTSQAIISLVNRSWALSFRDQWGIRLSELPVVGYAICASLCAANSMNALPQKGSLTVIIYAALFSGISGLVLQAIGNHRTLRALKTVNSKDTSSEIAS